MSASGIIETTARALSDADWIGPVPDDDWNHLTLGEQQSYRRRACRTMGAVYSTSVSRDHVSVAVRLPEKLALRGLTSDEAASIERYLHNKMEDALVWVFTNREQKRSFAKARGEQ